ncbi:hypothetical protein [Pseudalkalibacillus caeni]|uniref:Uncharacterized protein n=1 Tax=Exobacillus caeni TaxID=2574798 RepID=A0A5R9F0G5_9BACL|nr:hypothetical protein [Pseudalkalibacillus caeni]TLS37112.1 hypothetical protein FCL54_11325 [Pseudalkalibacillus caeni]
MNSNHRFVAIFSLLGVVSISAGMGFKSVFEYSPTVGWLSGFIFFLVSAFFANKLISEKEK